jgi:hypothetical protein
MLIMRSQIPHALVMRSSAKRWGWLLANLASKMGKSLAKLAKLPCQLIFGKIAALG